MAIKFPGSGYFAAMDAKSRIFVLVAAVVVIVIAVLLAVRFFGGAQSDVGASKVAAAPGGLQSVPGGQLSPEYYRALAQANAQATQQAQITGGSAVPTLVNVPGQTAFPDQNCSVVCPSEDKVDVSNDINDLVKSGKLTPAEASTLLDMAKQNVPVNQYAAALDALVKSGKLTPEQARDLLAKYKKQHDNALINQSAKTMDALVKSGKLPLEVANQLLALQKSHVSPADYEAELNRLVKEGKISPDTAAQLLAQYTQQQAGEAAKENAFGLQQLAKSGAITPDVANDLSALQAKNVPVDQYAAELQRLVAAGKITPAIAAQLLSQYKAQRTGNCPADLVASIAQQDNSAALVQMVKDGKLTTDQANNLLTLEKNNVSSDAFQANLNQIVAGKKLSAADAQTLAANYQKMIGLQMEAQKLCQLQANNATPQEYTDELKQAVQAGILTPAQAAALLQRYQAITMPVNIPGAAGTDSNLPATDAFSQLQQRLQTQQAQTVTAQPSVDAAQFAAAQNQAAAEAEQAREARIQKIQASMSSQAQSLLTAWQPPTMQHVGGSPPADKTTSSTSTISTSSTSQTGDNGTLGSTRSLIKAGTILYGVLDTSVDSDYPDTPVMVTIVQGPFKGAKLLGKLSLQQGKDKVSLNFSMMDMEGWLRTKSVNAFAIDPDTARTVMASSADYHYFERYGAIMATSFLSGYSSAITQEGTSTTGIFGTSTSHPSLSPGNKIAVGLGQIGTNLTAMAQTYINTPTTVKVNAGVGLGILFMAEVT